MTMKSKVVSMKEAIDLVKDDDCVVINGFGADDKITFTNVTDANTLNYGVSADGQDLLIDWQNTTTSTAEKIVLADVFANLQTAPFVSTYAEAVAALGGHNFITIA